MSYNEDTLTTEKLDLVTEVPSDGEIVAESQTNQGPHTQSINFRKFLEGFAKILQRYGVTCYILDKEKTLLTLEGTWQPDFVAVHDNTGIIVAVGECLTSHAYWGKTVKGKETHWFTEDTQPADKNLYHTNFKGDMKTKSTNFDSVTGLCEEEDYFKPFMFFVHGVRTVDASEVRFQETKAYVERHMLKKMLQRHGVNAVTSNLYKIGDNVGEQLLFGLDRDDMKSQLMSFVKSSTKEFEDNPKELPHTIPTPLGAIFSEDDSKEIIKNCKVERDVLLNENNLKGKGSARDFETGLWQYGIEHFDDIVDFVLDKK